MAAKPAEKSGEIVIMNVEQGVIQVNILGTTPLIMLRMSEKAKHELLLPAGRKTAADKAGKAKHDVIQEFRSSMHTVKGDGPTRLGIPTVAFKAAMRSAALDMPGTTKSQIGRLVYMPGDKAPVYGVPHLLMSVVRTADVNRTPDIRTRAILPEWAATIEVRYVKPILNDQAVANLLAASGFLAGVCEWRQQKGSGSYGSYKLVSAEDPDFRRIVATQGRVVQDAAIEAADPYDDETGELLSWYTGEAGRRGLKVVA